MEVVALDVEIVEGVSMKEQIWEYVVSLYKDIPQGVYAGLAVALCVGTILVMVVYGFQKGSRLAVGLLLVEYVFLLYSSTVMFRATSEQFSGYDYHLFWSYRAIQSGESPQLLVENIMNVVVFVPVGLLIGTQIAQKTQKGWLVAIAVGAGLSVGIETLQFVFNKGFSEVDDVMHNTIGCLIGYGIYRLICSIMYIFEGKR